MRGGLSPLLDTEPSPGLSPQSGAGAAPPALPAPAHPLVSRGSGGPQAPFPSLVKCVGVTLARLPFYPDCVTDPCLEPGGHSLAASRPLSSPPAEAAAAHGIGTKCVFMVLTLNHKNEHVSAARSLALSWKRPRQRDGAPLFPPPRGVPCEPCRCLGPRRPVPPLLLRTGRREHGAQRRSHGPGPRGCSLPGGSAVPDTPASRPSMCHLPATRRRAASAGAADSRLTI